MQWFTFIKQPASFFSSFFLFYIWTFIFDCFWLEAPAALCQQELKEPIHPFMSVAKIQEKALITAGIVARFAASQFWSKKKSPRPVERFSMNFTKLANIKYLDYWFYSFIITLNSEVSKIAWMWISTFPIPAPRKSLIRAHHVYMYLQLHQRKVTLMYYLYKCQGREIYEAFNNKAPKVPLDT